MPVLSIPGFRDMLKIIVPSLIRFHRPGPTVRLGFFHRTLAHETACTYEIIRRTVLVRAPSSTKKIDDRDVKKIN